MGTYRDDEIEQQINSVQIPNANVRIAYRQMLALERIATALEANLKILQSPPMILGTSAGELTQEAWDQLRKPGGFTVIPESPAAQSAEGQAFTDKVTVEVREFKAKNAEKDQVVLRPDAPEDEPPLDAA